MALLKKNTKVAKPEIKPVKTEVLVAPRKLADVSGILREARVTEKSAAGHERGVYVFDVRPDAHARLIAEAVFTYFKVRPVKVNVVTIAKKKVVVRGRRGEKGGGKKAYVYLKKGDKIEIA